MEAIFGGDFYFVHFNRQPGVADAVLEENTFQFLRNLYRKNVPPAEPQPGMAMINLARAETPLGEPVMSDSELAVFVSAFESTGFTGSINWYRNLDRNWHLLADVDPIIQQPTLMIYGDQDAVAKSEKLARLRAQRGRDQSGLRSLDPTRKAGRNEPSDFELAGTAGCHLAAPPLLPVQPAGRCGDARFCLRRLKNASQCFARCCSSASWFGGFLVGRCLPACSDDRRLVGPVAVGKGL